MAYMYKHYKIRRWDLLTYKFLSLEINEEDVVRAQLGLGHSFSRQKVSEDVNRADKPIT